MSQEVHNCCHFQMMCKGSLWWSAVLIMIICPSWIVKWLRTVYKAIHKRNSHKKQTNATMKQTIQLKFSESGSVWSKSFNFRQRSPAMKFWGQARFPLSFLAAIIICRPTANIFPPASFQSKITGWQVVRGLWERSGKNEKHLKCGGTTFFAASSNYAIIVGLW